MQEQFRAPGLQLSNAISHFYIARGLIKDSITVSHLAPNYEVLLMLDFGPEIRLSFGQQENEFNWVQLALQFGYYDQSHMSKDFNQYLGLSPKSFIKNRGSFCLAHQRV